MVDRLGWTLVHFVWEGAVVAALLALALLLTRRSAPGLRYGLALLALAVLAVLPVATFLLLAPAASADPGPLRSTAGEAILVGASRSGVGMETRMPVLVAVWSLGVVVLSLRLVGSVLHLERWRRRHAWAASDEEQSRLDALARRLGLRRRIVLFLSDRLEVPSAWGVLRPVVVLPASLMTGLSPAQLEGILLHELAHVRRHDYLVNLLQGVVETALFYHPAVWWVSGVVRREREHLCDDAAVAALGDPMPYARALLALEERRQAPRPALSAKEGNLMNRIARVLSPKPAPVRLSPLAPSLAALAVVGLALGGVLRAEAQTAPVGKGDAQKREIAAEKASALAEMKGAQSEFARAQRQFRQSDARLRAVQAGPKSSRSAAEAADVKKAQERLAAVRARLLAQQSQLQAQIAKVQADADAAQQRLDEARRRGATYGVPGKIRQPLWSAGKFPQGVAHLAMPKPADASAQDWAAMQKAQAELAQSMAVQRKAILEAQGEAARARVKADFDAARAAEAGAQDRDRSIAEAKAVQAQAEKAWNDAAQNRAKFTAQSKAEGDRIADLLRSGQAQTEAVKDRIKVLADGGFVSQDLARTFQGPPSDPVLRVDTVTPPPLFGQAKGAGTTQFGATRITTQNLRTTKDGRLFYLDPDKPSTYRIDVKTFGSSFAFGEPKVELGDHGRVSMDVKDTSFSAAVRALARKAKLSVVIERGLYGDLSLVISDRSASDALTILAKAAGAKIRSENGVYYIAPGSRTRTLNDGFGG